MDGENGFPSNFKGSRTSAWTVTQPLLSVVNFSIPRVSQSLHNQENSWDEKDWTSHSQHHKCSRAGTAWKNSLLLKKQRMPVEHLAPHPSSPSTCYLCYFWQQCWGSPVEVWISLLNLLANSIKGGFSMPGVMSREVQSIKKQKNQRCEPLWWHSLPGSCGTGRRKAQDEFCPAVCVSDLSQFAAAARGSFPFGCC